jgi:uncharacterized protein
MKRWLIGLMAAFVPACGFACGPGLYRSPAGAAVALAPLPDGKTRYLFVDGRRGALGDEAAPVRCVDKRLVAASGSQAWRKVDLASIDTHFDSHGAKLGGTLLRPPGEAPRPLLVMVHGSERTSPRDSVYPYIYAALGFDVFHYDKRGTGRSQGDFTMNFEILADDAADAMAEARRLDAGRYSRAGFFGGSQGGWVAPLASTRSQADFVVVGFGLTASPVEEDRDQILAELRAKGASPQDLGEATEVAAATALLVRSHFTTGYDELAAVRRKYSTRPWFASIRGEYSGGILSYSEADLRRIGRPIFDEVELIWDYDSVAALRRVKVPILWVLAEQDSEAPPEETADRLTRLRREGKDIALYSFPDTDHGMVEFRQAPDGTRAVTRITDGYFRLIGDWVWQRPLGTYGRGRKR